MWGHYVLHIKAQSLSTCANTTKAAQWDTANNHLGGAGVFLSPKCIQPSSRTRACTFMVSILSLSLRSLLMKSAFARRWLSSVSCSSFCAVEYRFKQSWAAGTAGAFWKGTHKAALSCSLHFLLMTISRFDALPFMVLTVLFYKSNLTSCCMFISETASKGGQKKISMYNDIYCRNMVYRPNLNIDVYLNIYLKFGNISVLPHWQEKKIANCRHNNKF